MKKSYRRHPPKRRGYTDGMPDTDLLLILLLVAVAAVLVLLVVLLLRKPDAALEPLALGRRALTNNCCMNPKIFISSFRRKPGPSFMMANLPFNFFTVPPVMQNRWCVPAAEGRSESVGFSRAVAILAPLFRHASGRSIAK